MHPYELPLVILNFTARHPEPHTYVILNVVKDLLKSRTIRRCFAPLNMTCADRHSERQRRIQEQQGTFTERDHWILTSHFVLLRMTVEGFGAPQDDERADRHSEQSEESPSVA